MPAVRASQPIRLYTTLLSGHGHRVKLFLTLLDLPFEVIELNMREGENRKPEYLALNPFGQVPTIQDGDITLFDSNAILVYLRSVMATPPGCRKIRSARPQYSVGCRSLRARSLMVRVPRDL